MSTESDDTDADPASTPVPLEASASKQSGDDEQGRKDELDEYFDSAPIPGVDLTQTSDGPSRNKNNH